MRGQKSFMKRKMKGRIIIALGDYYPNPSANGICLFNIVEMFVSEGYKVDLVANNTDDVIYNDKTGNIRVYFVELSLIQRIKKVYDNNKSVIKKIVLMIFMKMCIFFRTPIVMFRFPISSVVRCRQYEQIVESIVNENHDVDAIIGVHKPIESVYGAYKAAKKAHIPYYCYFLDPMVGGYSFKYLKAEVLNNREIQIEKKLIEESKKSVFMVSHKDNLCERYGRDISNKIRFLGPPLLKNNNFDYEGINREKKIIVYAGSIYKDIRNPQYIMNVFRYVKRAFLIMYISNPDSGVEEYINENVLVRESISHDEMIRQYMDADALLNIGNSDSVYIPSKIIEYISMLQPIISTYRIDDDSCLPYMKKYPLALCLDERKEKPIDAAKRIDDFIISNKKNITYEQIEKEYWINTPKAFFDEICDSE